METTGYGKKQYLILLASWTVATLLLPALYAASTYFLATKSQTNSFLLTSPISSILEMISIWVGSALLAFSAIRYRFKQCLPFAAVTVLANLILLTITLFGNSTSTLQGNSTFYSICRMLLLSAVPFINIGIARASATHLKKEIAVVFTTLFGMLIVSVIVQLLSRMLIFVFYQNSAKECRHS